jgi:hypothetical protein
MGSVISEGVMTRKPIPIPELTTPQIERFWDKVGKGTEGECWLWLGGVSDRGYGRLRLGDKTYSATRVAYYLDTGEDPGRLHICHTCDNPQCVNPNHLWAGDAVDNQMDCNEKGRRKTKITKREAKEILLSKESYRAIGEKYKVSKGLVSHIKAGRVWKVLQQ